MQDCHKIVGRKILPDRRHADSRRNRSAADLLANLVAAGISRFRAAAWP
jgi:hypothetical protein